MEKLIDTDLPNKEKVTTDNSVQHLIMRYYCNDCSYLFCVLVK